MSVCTSNLTSGFIDLATYDEQEKYLYGGPDAVAYFVREIRKATWFTCVPVCLSRSSGSPGFGQQWSVSISRAGDYLLQSWLRVTLPAVTATGTFTGGLATNTNWSTSLNQIASGVTGNINILRWTRNFMHNLVAEANITFNDLVAERFVSFHLDFWAAFTVPAGKRNGYNNMIGAVDSLCNPVATFPGGLVALGATAAPNNVQVLPSAVLNLPLPFFYARDTGLALPTAALPYNEMRINFVFRDWTELLVLDTFVCAGSGSTTVYNLPWVSTSASQSNIASPNAPVLGNVQVWSNYAIVSNEERKKMACAPRDILIEQVQTAPLQTFAPSGSSYFPTYDIRFSHAIKALFFAARNKTILNARSNYTAAQQLPIGVSGAIAMTTGAPTNAVSLPSTFGVVDFNVGNDPIINTSLIYESTQRLYQMGSDFFSMVNPWYNAPVIPLDTGYHLYSYSLDFFCIDPMGSTNYGKLTNVSIQPQASQDALTSTAALPANTVATNTNPNPASYAAQYEFVTTAQNNNIMNSRDKKATACSKQDKQLNRLVYCY